MVSNFKQMSLYNKNLIKQNRTSRSVKLLGLQQDVQPCEIEGEYKQIG